MRKAGEDEEGREPGEGGNSPRAISIPQCHCSSRGRQGRKNVGVQLQLLKPILLQIWKYEKAPNKALDCELNQTCNKPFVVSAFSKKYRLIEVKFEISLQTSKKGRILC